MKRKLFIMTVMILVLILGLTACTSDDNPDVEEQALKEKDQQINKLQKEKEQLESRIKELEKKDSNLLSRVIDVVEILREKDMKELSSYIHPTKGVRFSPYAYVDVESDQVFTKEEVAALAEDTEVYTWGSYDGSGEPINLNFDDYFNRFVYDKDFSNPHIIGNNTAIGQSNTINNISEVYPEGHFIEFHFTGFEEQYEGIDWKSLRLVFEQHEGKWYVVGVVHSEWTI